MCLNTHTDDFFILVTHLYPHKGATQVYFLTLSNPAAFPIYEWLTHSFKQKLLAVIFKYLRMQDFLLRTCKTH